MARFRRTFRGRRPGKPIHPTRWFAPELGDIDATFGAGVGIVNLISDDDLESITSPTLVRIRGKLSVGHSGNGLTEESHILHLGIIVLDDSFSWSGSFTTKENLERPWLWLWSGKYGTYEGSHMVWNGSASVAADGLRLNFAPEIEIDVKAARRIPRGNRLALVGEAVDHVGGADAYVRGIIRSLVKE